MKYCSFETRKVIDAVEQYGITVDASDYAAIERIIGTFWNTHVVKIIHQVMTGGDPAKKIQKAEMLGWRYFEKPILSMLSARGGAMRNEGISFVEDSWNEQVYNLVTANLLLADFNMTELALLVVQIPAMVSTAHNLSLAMQAARDRNVRTIYYLHGIIQREYQTAQGRIKEIQEQPESRGWEPPVNFEKLEPIERMELDQQWLDLQQKIALDAVFNEIARDTSMKDLANN